MGAQVLRNLNGREYLYYVYYDNKKRKEVYCGLSSKISSTQKSKKIQVIELETQKKLIMEKITILNNTICSSEK